MTVLFDVALEHARVFDHDVLRVDCVERIHMNRFVVRDRLQTSSRCNPTVVRRPGTIATHVTDKPHRRSVALLGVEWQPRALIRAQLIEDGFDVLATDSWPMMRHLVRS